MGRPVKDAGRSRRGCCWSSSHCSPVTLRSSDQVQVQLGDPSGSSPEAMKGTSFITKMYLHLKLILVQVSLSHCGCPSLEICIHSLTHSFNITHIESLRLNSALHCMQPHIVSSQSHQRQSFKESLSYQVVSFTKGIMVEKI